MKTIAILCFTFALTGCAGFIEKQNPICSGSAMVGGQDTLVQIYGVKKEAKQTKYKAGYPFNWKWVSANTFTKTNCNR